MAIIKPVILEKLTAEERKSILTRKSIDLTQVMQETVLPLSENLKTNTRQKLLEYTQKWDKCVPDPLVVLPAEMEKAYNLIRMNSPEIINAFQEAIDNIKAFHSLQVPENIEAEVSLNTLGLKFIPFNRIALYVPGGKALYPTTVMMGVIPARIAGVKDISIISPPNSQTGKVSDIVKAVSFMTKADRIIQAGGAQAILSMAYGIEEENIQPVDYIYGPGNKFVAAAKNHVFSSNLCGIDSFAGPSEVLIIADESANPYYLAHDFMAQAEHDEDASAILLVTSEKTARETIDHIEKSLAERKSRENITRNSIQKNGKIFIVNTLDEAVEFSNEYAPEHLEIQTIKDDLILNQITCAGSIFVGPYAPVAIGDYYSGTNHILPTSGAARFASGVSVQSFYKRVTWQKVTQPGLDKSCSPVTIMSIEEGLFDEHGFSVLARFHEKNHE
jgi:histidinol dehydrogenase